MHRYIRLHQETRLPLVRGVFMKEVSRWQAIALLTPIGAGILGIPFAVSKVGIGIGIIYIVLIGCLMMGLNLLIGQVLLKTKGETQLVGLAKTYLGPWGEYLMTAITYILFLGALLAYIIGVGEALAAILPGSAALWSIVFFLCGATIVFFGLRVISHIQYIFILVLVAVIIVLLWKTHPYIVFDHILYTDVSWLLFPYGVVLFSFNSTASLPEVHTLLHKHPLQFKQAIIWATILTMSIYIAFMCLVVSITGTSTTEIATVGLGSQLGYAISVLANMFAILAMGMSFLMIGVAFKDSLVWDYRWRPSVAALIVCGIPFILFILGVRQFIAVVGIIGGIFGSIQLALLVLICYKANRIHHRMASYRLHHPMIISFLLLIMCTVGAIYSMMHVLSSL